MKKSVFIALCLSMALWLTACSNEVEDIQEDGNTVTTESGVETQETEETSDEETEESTVKSSADAVSATGKEAKTESGAEALVTASGAKTTESGTVSGKASVDEDGISTDVDMTKVTLFDEAKVMYAQTNVNMRMGPSTDYETLGNIKTNTEVKVLGRFGSDGWYLIENGKGKAFVSNTFLGDEKIDLEALRAEQEAAALAAIQNQQAQAANQAQDNNNQQQAQAAPPQPVAAPAGILFIGDSRCVQMQAAVGGGNSSWICENSKGYEWFSNKAVGQADACIGKGTKVVICLGVNDTDNIYNYAALVNAKAAEWAGRGAKTYFVSVNPVTENPYRTEEEVEAFNATLPGQLSGVKWIDTHSFLVNNGYTMVDGLHYDSNTYVAIFNAIVGSLK